MGFISETTVKAVRKQHTCFVCGTAIDVGQPAYRWAGTTDGDFSSCIYHPPCREAEIAYNRYIDLNSDEWLVLFEALYEGGEDFIEWLRHFFPTVAARFEPV